MTKTFRKISALTLFTVSFCVFFALGCSDNVGDSSKNGKNTYTVNFDLCTELETTKVLPKKVESGSRINKPQVYVTGDYEETWEIEGWYMEETYVTEWDFYFDEVESDMTLYAKWKANMQYSVNYYKNGEDYPTYTTKIKAGLQASECDEQFKGYEVFGYYTSADFTTKFDFETPINSTTDIYVKLSDYIYFTPRYLSMADSKDGASASLARDGKCVEITYATPKSFIYAKDLNFATNGYELLELAYKLEGGARADIYWYASDSDGMPIADQFDFNEVTKSVGAKDYGADITVDEDGWTHVVYDLTRPKGYTDGSITSPLKDIAVLNGFRLDVTGNYANATLTVKYIKAHKKPAATSNDVNIHVDEKRVKTITVPVGETLERPNDADIVTGRRVEGYYTTPAFDEGSEYEFGSTVEEETNLYAKLSDYIYFNGAMIKQFTPLDGADTTLNADGTVTVAGAKGSYVHKKGLNLAVNRRGEIEIRAKLVGITRVDVWIFGAYSLNGDHKVGTDYVEAKGGLRYRGVDASYGYTAVADGEYTVMTFDLAYANGNSAKDLILETIAGIRIETAAVDSSVSEPKMIIDYVKTKTVIPDGNLAVRYYVGETVKHTAKVNVGSYVPKLKDEDVAFGRQIAGYYTDAALTNAFDFTKTLSADTNVYVRLSDYAYFNGEMLKNGFTGGAATKTLNADGTLTLLGADKDKFIHQKGLNLSVEGANRVEIRAKQNGVYRLDLYLFGNYTLDGNVATGTDYDADKGGFRYRGVDASYGYGVVNDGEYVIMTYDLSYANGNTAKDLVFNVINGFRIDIVGVNNTITDSSIVIDYVKIIKR